MAASGQTLVDLRKVNDRSSEKCRTPHPALSKGEGSKRHSEGCRRPGGHV